MAGSVACGFGRGCSELRVDARVAIAMRLGWANYPLDTAPTLSYPFRGLRAVISLTRQKCCRPRVRAVLRRRGWRLTLFPGHREKSGHFLLHILAAAMRATDCFFVVFVQGENLLKRLVAVVADVVVYGHGEHLACRLCKNCNSSCRRRDCGIIAVALQVRRPINGSPCGDVIPMRRAREGSYEKHRTITGARGTDGPVSTTYSASRRTIPHRLTQLRDDMWELDRHPSTSWARPCDAELFISARFAL